MHFFNIQEHAVQFYQNLTLAPILRRFAPSILYSIVSYLRSESESFILNQYFVL